MTRNRPEVESWGVWAEAFAAPCGCRPRGSAPIIVYTIHALSDPLGRLEGYIGECRDCGSTWDDSDRTVES